MDDMTQVQVTLANYDARLNNLEKAYTKLEATAESIHDMSLSINKLAITMEGMLIEQKAQGERIKTLEAAPGDTYATIKRTFLTSIVSGIAGCIVTILITLLSK